MTAPSGLQEYDVKIFVRITKVYRVKAANAWHAEQVAHETFNRDVDHANEIYWQDTVYVRPVKEKK